jgi:tetratricopeptide (TPR) repeat protein
MKMIDPTYLRTIHDGLLSGAIHKDNASTLPIGLIGIYEEALPHASNVNKRRKFLEFFAVWALLKKEVSAAFVVPLLEGWTEEHILDYISQYSKWFNSPVSGKYVLYHERLRSFLLQKISQGHFTACNEAIIQNCQTALIAKTVDEWEFYALEHLSLHLLIQTMESKDAAALKTLAYDTTHWNRQVEISKGFEWSKRMLNDMMLWASKYDDDEVIECALNKVDLHHQEQNDAPRIVELVAQNDIEMALQRIEAFGGNDKEGLQRKFILYMLCLMELTLLDSKDKPFRKDAIDKLLKHLDENLPVDHSVLNWNDFFPSYMMFQMACEWAEMGLDYLILYKRTNDWENDWILDKGPYGDKQFEVLFECVRIINDVYQRSSLLAAISTELSKQRKLELVSSTIEEAIECARSISEEADKSRAWKKISIELTKQNKLEVALEYVEGIYDETIKSRALEDISTELVNQGKIKEALVCTQGIPDGSLKSGSLAAISNDLAKRGQIEEALVCARGIPNELIKSDTLAAISNYLAKRGKIEEALVCARGIPNELIKSGTLAAIDTERVKQGKPEDAASAIQEALTCARNISDESYKSHALAVISTELLKQGMNDDAASEMQAALACARGIIDEKDKSRSMVAISTELTKQGKLEEALAYVRDLRHRLLKSKAFTQLSCELTKQGKIEKANSVFQEATHASLGYSIKNPMIDISRKLSKKGKIEEALNCARGISNDFLKSRSLLTICSELTRQGKFKKAASVMQEALECARDISDIYKKLRALIEISNELAKMGEIFKGSAVIQEVLVCRFYFVEDEFNPLRGIGDEDFKIRVLFSVSIELVNQGEIERAILCVQAISNYRAKIAALKSISRKLAKKGKFEKALECAQSIPDEAVKRSAIKDITSKIGIQSKSKEVKSLKDGSINSSVQYYNTLKGYADSVSTTNATKKQILEARLYFFDEIESLELLLSKHALYELFFTDAKHQTIKRFNQSLNIQWAIDIKNQFT